MKSSAAARSSAESASTATSHSPVNANKSSRRGSTLQAGGVLLSLAGILACNYFGLGAARAVCQGALIATLGAPHRRSSL